MLTKLLNEKLRLESKGFFIKFFVMNQFTLDKIVKDFIIIEESSKEYTLYSIPIQVHLEMANNEILYIYKSKNEIENPYIYIKDLNN
jgi:hypothetical protein